MKKFTFICHEYIGHGSYIVTPRRVQCKPEQLSRYLKRDLTIHFVIDGWPLLFGADGTTPWDFDFHKKK